MATSALCQFCCYSDRRGAYCLTVSDHPYSLWSQMLLFLSIMVCHSSVTTRANPPLSWLSTIAFTVISYSDMSNLTKCYAKFAYFFRGWCVVYVERYLQNHIDDVFAGAWEPSSVTPLPPNIPSAPVSRGSVHLVRWLNNISVQADTCDRLYRTNTILIFGCFRAMACTTMKLNTVLFV